MTEEGEYCTHVLDQSLAIQNSLKSLDTLVLEKHLRAHVAVQFKSQKEKAVKELIKVFKRKQKSQLWRSKYHVLLSQP